MKLEYCENCKKIKIKERLDYLIHEMKDTAGKLTELKRKYEGKEIWE